MKFFVLVSCLLLSGLTFGSVPFKNQRDLPVYENLEEFSALDLVSIHFHSEEKKNFNEVFSLTTRKLLESLDENIQSYFNVKNSKKISSLLKLKLMEFHLGEIEKALATEVKYIMVELRFGSDWEALGFKSKSGIGRFYGLNGRNLRYLIWLNSTGQIWSLTDK
jgi:hypothetical protein